MNKSVFIKNKNIVLSLVFSFLFSCSAYVFGFFNNSTRLESALLNLHDISISDKSSNFLHTEFYGKNDDTTLFGKSVVNYIDSSNGIDTSKTILNPYCYLSDNGIKKTFTVNCNNKTLSTDCSISGVHLYTDKKIMQNIALPLFRTEGNIYRLNNGRNGADSGCYIPCTLANEIIKLLPDVDNFDELIDSAQIIEIDGENDLPRTKFSINNIYFDVNDHKDWDNDNKKSYVKSFGNYNSFFSSFNNTTLFVAIYDSFPNEETTFCCDLKDGYGTLSVFINSVITNSFSKEGYELRFYLSPTNEVANDLNDYVTGPLFTNTFLAVLFLVFSIVFVGAAFVFSLSSLRNLLSFKQSIVFIISLLFVFILFWCLPYFISLFGIGAKYFTYLWLNKIGNEVILIGSLLLLGSLSLLAVKKK